MNYHILYRTCICAFINKQSFFMSHPSTVMLTCHFTGVPSFLFEQKAECQVLSLLLFILLVLLLLLPPPLPLSLLLFCCLCPESRKSLASLLMKPRKTNLPFSNSSSSSRLCRRCPRETVTTRTGLLLSKTKSMMHYTLKYLARFL